MKVILKEDVLKLGKTGDIVSVAHGYARNYLLPQNKAIPATEENIQNREVHKNLILKKSLQEKGKYEETAQKLSQFTCTITKKVGKNEKLFGSVTSQDIFAVLSQNGFHLDRRAIHLENPIKTSGTFEVPIKLHPEVSCVLKVEVKAL